MNRYEFYTKLLNATMEYPIPRVLAVIAPADQAPFCAFVEEMRGITDDSQIGSTDGSPGFGVAEIRNMLTYFRDHPDWQAGSKERQ